jgi:hypothetical protein
VPTEYSPHDDQASANYIDVAVSCLVAAIPQPHNHQFVQDRDQNPNPRPRTSTNNVDVGVPRLDTEILPSHNYESAQDQGPGQRLRIPNYYSTYPSRYMVDDQAEVKDILNLLANGLWKLSRVLNAVFRRNNKFSKRKLVVSTGSNFDKISRRIQNIYRKIELYSTITCYHLVINPPTYCRLRSMMRETNALERCLTKSRTKGQQRGS